MRHAELKGQQSPPPPPKGDGVGARGWEGEVPGGFKGKGGKAHPVTVISNGKVMR